MPGVVADPKAAILTAAGKATLRLSAQVASRRSAGGASPPPRRRTARTPPPRPPVVRYGLATPPAHGTATVTTAGAVTYDSAGAPVADVFTVVAEDSRGLRSAPAKVFIDPPGSGRRVGLGRARTSPRPSSARRSRFRVGQARSFAVRVPKGQKQATFSASWNAGTFAISVRKPGTRQEIRKNARGIKLRKARTFRSLTVTHPKPGLWRYTVTRKAGGPRVATATIRASLLRKG